MVIPVRSTLIGAFVPLFGICLLWSSKAIADEPGRYGPIAPGDTLGAIAIKLKGDGPWHYRRWMYLLYQKNLHAFREGNMNNLKPGTWLQVPSEDELKHSDLAEAFRAVKIHHYVLEQGKLYQQEGSEALWLHTRLERLLSTNEMVQQESGALFEQVAAMELQVGNVVDHVLERGEGERQKTAQSPQRRGEDKRSQTEPESNRSHPVSVGVEDKNFSRWWTILMAILAVYLGGFIWRKRLEANL